MNEDEVVDPAARARSEKAARAALGRAKKNNFAPPAAREVLRKWFLGLPRERRRVVASRGRTSVGQIIHIYTGKRPCQIEYAFAFHAESGGVVPMQELRPDVDWESVLDCLMRSRRKAPKP